MHNTVVTAYHALLILTHRLENAFFVWISETLLKESSGSSHISQIFWNSFVEKQSQGKHLHLDAHEPSCYTTQNPIFFHLLQWREGKRIALPSASLILLLPLVWPAITLYPMCTQRMLILIWCAFTSVFLWIMTDWLQSAKWVTLLQILPKWVSFH